MTRKQPIYIFSASIESLRVGKSPQCLRFLFTEDRKGADWSGMERTGMGREWRGKVYLTTERREHENV